MNLDRIVIYGNTGAGKSTLAMKLGKLLKIASIHLDDIFWKPFWEMTPYEEFKSEVEQIVKNDKWIIDGNYSKVRSLILPKATFAIILDPPLVIIFWRLFRRTLARSTGIKWEKTTPLPKQIKENGGKEYFIRSFLELGFYAIKTKIKRKLKKIEQEVLTVLEPASLIVLRTNKKIAKFIDEIVSNLENI